ncbi:MAG: MFS transporter, partial [Pseudomonadota bacterium]
GFLGASLAVASGPEALLIASTVYSLGMSPVFTLGIDAIVTAAPADRAGAAAALSETGAELGGAVGVAVLGTIASGVYRAGLGHSALDGVPAEARKAALDTLAGAVVSAAQLPSGAGGATLLAAARHAYTLATQVMLVLCAFVCAALAVVAMIALPRARR